MRQVRLVVLGLALIVYGLYATYLYRFTPDDAFIFLRYAHNWAAGDGPVFNPGVREQGYTSFLWVALLTAARGIGVDGLVFAKVTGAILGALLVVLTQVLGSRLRHQRAFQVSGAGLVLACFPDLAAWAVSGMETALFAVLVTVGVLLYVDSERNPGLWAASAAALSLSALARPEGVLFLVFILAHGVASRPRATMPRFLGIGVCVGLLPVVGLYLWSWSYYGSLLPNTYYAKRLLPSSALYSGMVYLYRFLADAGGSVLVLLALVSLAIRENRHGRLLGGLVLTLAIYLVVVGGDMFVWLRSYRFLVPILPFLAVLMDSGLSWLVAQFKPPLARTAQGAAVLALVVLFAALQLQNARALPKSTLGGDAYLADWLKRAARPGDALMVGDVGRFGYETSLPIVDTCGLTDRFVSRLWKIGFARFGPDEARRLVEHLYAKDARFVVLKGSVSASGFVVANECGAREFYEDARFAPRYRFVTEGREGPYLLFERREPQQGAPEWPPRPGT